MTPPEWAREAEALMERAVATDWSSEPDVQSVKNQIGVFYQRHGEKLLATAVCEWVDHARHETGYEPVEGSTLNFEPHDGAGRPVPHDQVPPGLLWAARFVTARLGDDLDQQTSLMDMLRSPLFPPEDFSAAITTALRLTSTMIRTGHGVQDRTPPEPAWAADATAVFDAAAASRWNGPEGALALLQQFATTYGTATVVNAMKGWCRHVRTVYAPGSAVAAAPAAPGWRTTDTGVELPVDEVPAGPRWAGRFMAAVCNDDADQVAALLQVPRTTEKFTECVVETLIAASSLVGGTTS
jgi:hypothetical protein